MNQREKRFLLGGAALGILLAVVGVGAVAIFNPQSHQHTSASAPASPARNAAEPSGPDMQLGTITLSPDEINAAGVQLAEVRTADLKTDVDAFGRVEQPEAQLATISARFSGRIDRLYVQYTGQAVRRGQAVADLYSPKAASAVEEYRLALENRDRLRTTPQAEPEAIANAEELVSASRRRLELWGISDKQLAPSDAGAVPHLTLYSPAHGTVVERKVAVGQYVNTGDTLFTVADLSTVWVKAEVYESQLPQVRRGQRVQITSDALPDTTIHGNVEFIEPAASPQTRTVPVHVHVSNPGLRLVPGMYVRARFIVPATRRTSLVVPRSAVLDTGTRTMVFVANPGGVFEARHVEVGTPTEEMYPVFRGLKLGEKVVTDGNFLIDSQSRLTGGMTSLFGGSKEFAGAPNHAGAAVGAAASSAKEQARITFGVEPDPPKGAADNTFHVNLTDASGKAIAGANVRVTLVMPAMPAMNMPEMRNTFELPWVADRQMYLGKGNVPTAGSWNVTVEASRNGKSLAVYRARLAAK